MPVVVYVEEAMEEPEDLQSLEPTLENQLVAVVDALSASVPPTSSARVTALGLDQIVAQKSKRMHTNFRTPPSTEEANIQIFSSNTELDNVKKLGAVINVRTSMMHAVPCVAFVLQTRTSYGWLWNASHVVTPLLNDSDLPPNGKTCKCCLSQFNLTSTDGLLRLKCSSGSDRQTCFSTTTSTFVNFWSSCPLLLLGGRPPRRGELLEEDLRPALSLRGRRAFAEVLGLGW